MKKLVFSESMPMLRFNRIALKRMRHGIGGILIGAALVSPAAAQELSGVAAVAAAQGYVAAPGWDEPSDVGAAEPHGLVGGISDYGPGAKARQSAAPAWPARSLRQARGRSRERHLARLAW